MMSVPDFQSLMLPVLEAFSSGKEQKLSEARDRVASAIGLSDEDIQKKMPGRNQTFLVNRVSWAATYMQRAKLLQRVSRGVYRLTDDGEQLLSSKPKRIDINLLKKYPAYVEWNRLVHQKRMPREEGATEIPEQKLENTLNQTIQKINRNLEADILHRVRDLSPNFLENVIVKLLIAMGYGEGDSGGCVTGGSGDGGIDGIIRQDKLGLEEVYLQAKRYAEGNNVGESDLRNFVGAIDAAGTTKGVFVTTADFTKAARDYVERSPKRIILIDGAMLARLMVQHGVGVRTHDVHEIKKIDEDYFEDCL